MAIKPKRKGFGLNLKTFSGEDVRTFSGKCGYSYLVFRTRGGSFHTFVFVEIEAKKDSSYLVFRAYRDSFPAFILVEVDAKEAARQCGNHIGTHTRRMWDSIWNKRTST